MFGVKKQRYDTLSSQASRVTKEYHDDSSDQSSLEAGEEDGSYQPPHDFDKRSWVRSHWRAVTFHFILVALNITISFLAVTNSNLLAALRCQDFDPQHSPTPFAGVIDYEPRRFEVSSIYLANGSINPFRKDSYGGTPRPALEKAWRDLQKYQHVRVNEQELGQFSGDDSLVKLTDGSGYYVTVAVYHGIHCVERLHKFLYPETYYPNISATDFGTLKQHTEHCIDWLRQYVACNADTTLVPLHFSDSIPQPTAKDGGHHQCAKWEPIEEWMREHSFNPFTPGLIMHPKYGSPYKDLGDPTKPHLNLGIVPLKDSGGDEGEEGGHGGEHGGHQ